MQEIWLPVHGFEGFYEVSSDGQIRSLARVVKSRWGTDKHIRSVLKAFGKNSQGYQTVHLYRDGKCNKFYAHRLVAAAHIPNPYDLPQVNHIDGNKKNNTASNLEWCTASENCQHAVKEEIYRSAKGEQIFGAKVTEDAVRTIRLLASTGVMHKVLAAQFGIGRKAITKIVNLQRWKHVT